MAYKAFKAYIMGKAYMMDRAFTAYMLDNKEDTRDKFKEEVNKISCLWEGK